MADGVIAGEPIFVPRSANAAEDDGWLLTLTYLPREHRTALTIVSAKNIESAPIAVAHTHSHFFPGFHGSWVDHVT